MTTYRSELRAKWQPFFQDLFQAYPRRVGFGEGFSVFLDLMAEGSVDPQFIMEKAKSYARNVDPSELKYVPHIKKWLRERQFEDADLFTDQVTARREWFTGRWREGDAKSVSRKYGFIYNHPPVPEGCEDVEAWHLDQRKLWISQVANHILHGKEPPG